jgi:hypothetical protein
MIYKFKDTFFLSIHKIKQKIYLWMLKYRNIKLLYGILFFILLFRSFDVVHIGTNHKNDILSFLKSKSDYEDYYSAAILLKNKQNPYHKEKIKNFFLDNSKENLVLEEIFDELKNLKGVGSYLYPPLFAFLLIPLTYFSYNVSAIIYQIIQLFFLIVTLFFLSSIVNYLDIKFSKRKIYISILLSLISYYPLQLQNISNGNVGFLLLFLISFSLYLFYKYNYLIFDFFNGLIIGIATIIKVLPGFIGGFYLIKRRYFIILGMLIGIIIGIFLPAIYLGFNLNWELFQSWYELIIKTYQKYSVIRPYANNQTISGAISKLFIPFSDLKQFEYGLPINVFNLSFLYIGNIIKFINNLLLFNLVVITLFYYFKRIKFLTFELYYLYIVFLTALLTSGISWYHTYSLLLIIYFFYFLYNFKFKDLNNKIFLIPVIYIWFFSIMPFRIKDFLSLYSIFTWINLIILLYLCFIVYKFILQGKKYG